MDVEPYVMRKDTTVMTVEKGKTIDAILAEPKAGS